MHMDIQKHINDSCEEAEKALQLYRMIVDSQQYSRMEHFMKCYLAFSDHAAKGQNLEHGSMRNECEVVV